MNANAINYNPDANVDDGSCDCNREMFYGTYDITSICAHINSSFIPDTTYYVIEIHADSSNGCKVAIINFMNYGDITSHFVSGNNILVPTETYQMSGWIENHYATITFSGDSLYIHTSIIFDGNQTNFCDMIGIKQ